MYKSKFILPILTLFVSIGAISSELDLKWRLFLMIIIVISTIVTIIQDIETQRDNQLMKRQLQNISYTHILPNYIVDEIISQLSSFVRKINFLLRKSTALNNGNTVLEFEGINGNNEHGLLYLENAEIVELSFFLKEKKAGRCNK